MQVRHKLNRAHDKDGLEAMYAIEAIEQNNALAAFYREVAVVDGWQDTETLKVHLGGSAALTTEMCLLLAVAGLVDVSYNERVDAKVSALREAVEAWL